MKAKGALIQGALAVVGLVAAYATWQRQDDQIGQTVLWVLPNPSGLNANYQAPDLARLFRELKDSL